jgi:putative oxidoreductase
LRNEPELATSNASQSSARGTATATNAVDVVALLLRLLLGLLILVHGAAKIGTGPGAILDLDVKAGLPAATGYLVYVGEVAAPLLLIIGVWTRAAALVIAINMIVALALVHSGQLLSLGPGGGYALEVQAMYLFVAIAIALLGAGNYSAGGSRGRWN